MKRFIVFLFLTVTSILFGQSPGFQWAIKMGGIAADGAYDVCVDPFGNVFTTGSYMSDPFNISPTSTLGVTGCAGFDMFVSKHDGLGNYLWGGKLWANCYCEFNDMITDNTGNLYVTGYFVDSVDCDLGPSVSYLTSLNSGGLVIKYNSNGGLVWAKKFTYNVGNCGAQGKGLAVDASGNVYVTGYFQETIDFDPGPATNTLVASNSPNSDIFIAKLNPLGNLVWVKQIGGAGNDNSESLGIDAGGNIIITGKFQNTVDFNPGAGTFNLSSPGGSEMYVAKYDTNGNFIWAGQIGGGAANITVLDLKVDASGSTYAAGWFSGIMDCDPSAAVNTLSCTALDAFLIRLGPNGNYKWAHQFGGSNADELNSIAVDNKCNVYGTGYFQLTCDFDPGPGTYTYTAPGVATNIFNLKLDSTGTFVWANHMPGTSMSIGNSIAVDLPGNVFTVGRFNLLVDFNPFSGVSNLISYGDEDAFIQKLNQGPSDIQSKNKSDVISVYPNPSNGIVYIESNNVNPFEIVIYNILGQRVYAKTIKQEYSILDLEFLQKGIYSYFIIGDANQSSSGKLIID